MRFYDYTCAEGHEFSARNRVEDRKAAPCPECGATAKMQFNPSAGFFISEFMRPDRKTPDELMVGRALMGSGYTMMNDPNEPYRVEALADAESQVRRADEVRARARTHFEGSVDYLEGDRRDEAKRTMEKALTRKGVRL